MFAAVSCGNSTPAGPCTGNTYLIDADFIVSGPCVDAGPSMLLLIAAYGPPVVNRRCPLDQVYLCTEGCILAHADIDMSFLLPRWEWGTRSTSQFCRTGIEGGFHLHLPGELMAQPDQHNKTLQRRQGDAVVTIGAELTRIGATPGECIRGEAAGSVLGEAKAGVESGSGSGGRGGPEMRTWAYLAGKRQLGGAITASLQRLELRPAAIRGGERLADRRQGVLVGIHGADESMPPRDTAAGVTMTAAGAETALVGGQEDSVPLRGFGVVGCTEMGEVDTEDASLLQNIAWKWEGEFPPGGTGGTGGRQLEAGRRPLAVVRVLGEGPEHVEVAAGLVPWPSPSHSSSGRQHVDVKLMSPEGSEVGSCRVCLSLAVGNSGVDRAGVGGHRESVEADGVSVLSEGGESEHASSDGAGQGGRVHAQLAGVAARVRAGAKVISKGVQAEELALEGGRKAAGGEVPRSYRLSVNLASVKDLENAAYVVGALYARRSRRLFKESFHIPFPLITRLRVPLRTPLRTMLIALLISLLITLLREQCR